MLREIAKERQTDRHTEKEKHTNYQRKRERVCVCVSRCYLINQTIQVEVKKSPRMNYIGDYVNFNILSKIDFQ